MLFFNHAPVRQIESFAVSNVGRVRANNEDNFAVNGVFMDEVTAEQSANGENVCVSGGIADAGKISVLAVCDGIGGGSIGEAASLIGAEQFAGLHGSEATNFDALVDRTIEKANSLVLQKAEQSGYYSIGSTLALAYIQNGILHSVNLGDSRVYLMRKGKLTQLSYDHTELQFYIRAKIIKKEDAKDHPLSHRLTQHLGIDPDELKPYRAKTVKLTVGDKILLCSDGVTGMLEDDALTTLLGAAPTPESAAKTIVAQALENGGNDNTTAVVAFIS